MHDSRNRRFAALGILGVAVSMSCGESPTALQGFGPPAALQIVTGRSQIGAAGQGLPEPLTVQVLDAAGHGLRGLSVTWTVSGGGTLFARAVPTVTDSLGLVMVFWQLGPAFGNQQVIAHCCGLNASFSAQAQLPLSQRVGFYSGIGQQATVGQPLTYPIVIQVLKADGTADTGVPVAFRAISRGSTYSPADTITNSQGQASTRWTLGTVAGVESTAVLVRGLPPVVITATATPGAPVRVTIAPTAVPVLGVIGDTSYVTAQGWDQYGNRTNGPVPLQVADSTIGVVALGYWYGFPWNYVTARHHGTTWIKGAAGLASDSVPFTVLGFSGVSDGGGHTCGLSLGGDAYCWGENHDGPIGDGTRIDRPRPVPVGQGLGLQVPYTDLHTCALDANGHAYCWGPDYSGELGDGVVWYLQTSPVPVVGGQVFSAIRTGRSHTCAVATNGDAYCWGGNYSGQVGRDTLTSTCLNGGNRCSNVPILVAGGLQFAQVSAGSWEHSCGVTTSGAAYCWGLNASGELGNDSTTDVCTYPPGPCSFTPRLVEGGIVFKSVKAGGYFSCGLSITGDGYCWGHGNTGELGNGANVSSTMPVKVAGGLSFADVQAGRWNSCGLTTAGKLYCWGGSYGASPVPVLPSLVFTSLAVGGDASAPHACALTTDNDLYCWYSGPT